VLGKKIPKSCKHPTYMRQPNKKKAEITHIEGYIYTLTEQSEKNHSI